VHGRALTVACVYVLSRRYGLLESKRKDGERLAGQCRLRVRASSAVLTRSAWERAEEHERNAGRGVRRYRTRTIRLRASTRA
jgi:hypothetical protein